MEEDVVTEPPASQAWNRGMEPTSGPWSRLPEIRILHIAGDPADQARFTRALDRTFVSRAHRLQLEQVDSLAEGLKRLATQRYGLVVANLELRDSTGIATVEALAPATGESHLVVYARDHDAVSVAAALERGVGDFFDAAIFDPRVLDQVLGRLIERFLMASSLMEVVRGRDAVLAHRREAERQMHRLLSALLAVTLEPLARERAIGGVLERLIGDVITEDLEAGACFLHDVDAGVCRLLVHRGLDPAGVPDEVAIDTSECGCLRPRGDCRTRFFRPEDGPPPPCQAILGHHACYVSTLLDQDAEPLGSLVVTTRPENPVDAGLEELVENASRILSSIIIHHRHLANIRRLQQVVEQSPLSVLLTDADGQITYANPKVYELTGYQPGEVLGMNPRLFASGLVSRKTFEAMWSQLRAGEVWEGELINRKKGGELFTEQAIISPVFDTSGRLECYAAVKRDITEELEFKARIRHQATHDALTDLANRGLVGDRVSLAINHARRDALSVVALLIDIDDFRALNEAHGHAAGDEVLREVARRLSAQARDYDTVARLGNDEFIVILGDVGKDHDILTLASRYMALFEAPFMTEGGRFKLTASMGIAVYPLDSTDGEELLRHAAMALARQKSLGPGGYALFGQEMEQELRERYEMLSALRTAVETEQFELHYQPQIDPVTGRVAGAEVLLRWTLPDGRAIPPVKFIPLAESCGLIVPIGAWVLRTACLQFAAWTRELGLAIPVSINVSTRQFREAGFVDAVRSALDESGLDPALVVLELTESLLLEEHEEAKQLMEQLNALGVRLAIDDFGTGYSSLSYLTRLPIRQLKVDRAFINQINDAPQSAIIASTIIGMGHSLGMEVVAEGAETEDQVEFLKTYRCELIQGYYYSRPLPAREFAGLLPAPPWLTGPVTAT